MSALRLSFKYNHVLPEDVVCEEATRQLDQFVADGGEPEGLDYRNFVPVAVQTLVDDRIQHAEKLGMSLTIFEWCLMENGDARVSVKFPCEAKAVLFEALVL